MKKTCINRIDASRRDGFVVEFQPLIPLRVVHRRRVVAAIQTASVVLWKIRIRYRNPRC